MSDKLYKGFEDLSKELEYYIKNVENVQDVLEVGAKEFVTDLLKLPKPISQIRKSGYTHLINTFAYRRAKNKEIEVGWGKYYGPMVERGSDRRTKKGMKRISGKPHLEPLWNTNKNKYYDKMLVKLGH